MVAAVTADRAYLTLAVVNATASAQEFDLNVTGARPGPDVTLARMTGNDLAAANHVGKDPEVKIEEMTLNNSQETIRVAPISINIYRVPLLE